MPRVAKKKKIARKPAPTAIAKRCVLLRYATGNSQTAFARLIGIEMSHWHNFEHTRRLTRDVAERIKQKIPGITTDWLLSGDKSGLTVYWNERINEAEKRYSAEFGEPGNNKTM